MSSGRRAGLLNRRAFLRSFGMVVGATAGGRLLAGSAGATPPAAQPHTIALAPPAQPGRGAALTIGVVVPQSHIAPALSASLLNGLRFAAAQGSADIQLEPIWYDTIASAPQQVASMLDRGRADLIVAAMSRHAAADLGPLLAERDTPLIVSDVGAHMLRPKQVHPFVFRSSLNYWRSAWALGQWAAVNAGPRALIASAFYDSGFDTIYSFWTGFEQAGGAQPRLVVTHRPNGGDMADVLAAIQQTQPDLVFAAYSGKRAVAFVHDYAAANLAGRPALLGGGFLADEALLPQQGDAALGIRSAHSWANQGGTPEQRAFAAGYQAFAGSSADSFAALGYDTGRLILAAAASAPSARPAGALRDALAAAAIDGPRGRVQFDQATLEACSPVYLREVRRGAGAAEQIVTADLTELAARPLEAPAGPRGGWRNAFLMV